MAETLGTADPYEVVASTADLRPDSIKRVDYRGKAVALVRVGDRYFALANTCAHQNISLSLGRVFRKQVVCPGHGWMYDPETGRVMFPRSADALVACYDVRVEGEQILIAPRTADDSPPS